MPLSKTEITEPADLTSREESWKTKIRVEIIVGLDSNRISNSLISGRENILKSHLWKFLMQMWAR